MSCTTRKRDTENSLALAFEGQAKWDELKEILDLLKISYKERETRRTVVLTIYKTKTI